MEIELFGYFPSIINCMKKKYKVKWERKKIRIHTFMWEGIFN